MIHQLKIREEYYLNIMGGKKKFEVRYNDRDYQVGDELFFTSTDGNLLRQGRWKIIYIHTGLGMEENYVILGIEAVN